MWVTTKELPVVKLDECKDSEMRMQSKFFVYKKLKI